MSLTVTLGASAFTVLANSTIECIVIMHLEIAQIEENIDLIKWIRLNVTANGLSSSKLIYNDDGKENRELSRRVEFRVKTNAEQRIQNILFE